MNKNELTDNYLLYRHNVIWLAETIDEETLMRITREIEYLRDCDDKQPIKLYVRSDGGDSRCGLALANMIQMVGNVHGIMIGDTASSAATVWAACSKRFVFKNVRMGIHPVQWRESEAKYDGAKLSKLANEFNSLDERQCEVYAQASNKDFAWWWHRYTEVGDVKWLHAAELVRIGMAEYLEDVK
jgi:ATP-dependent protease ClpP protease subunit